MSEVIDFHTREPVSSISNVPESRTQNGSGVISNVLRILEARKNDRIRKKMPLKKINSSYDLKCATNDLDNNVLESIFDQVRFSKFDDIDFWTLSDQLISNKTREQLEQTHSGGLLHAGDNPTVSVVWLLDSTKKTVRLLTADEFFQKVPV